MYNRPKDFSIENWKPVYSTADETVAALTKPTKKVYTAEFVVVVGAKASGKSTLIRHIASLAPHVVCLSEITRHDVGRIRHAMLTGHPIVLEVTSLDAVPYGFRSSVSRVIDLDALQAA